MSTAIDTSQPSLAMPLRGEPLPPVAQTGRHRRLRIALVAASLVSAVVLVLRIWPMLFVPPVESTVRASGRIEGREMTLAAKTIQGRVKRLLVDEGQTIRKGQLVAELDAAQVEAQAAAARASVATADAQVHQARLDVAFTVSNSDATIAAAAAALSSARARVERVNAILAHATAAYERASALVEAGAIAKQDFDAAQMVLRTSQADVAAAERDAVQAEAHVALAQASRETIELKRQQLRALQESQRTAVARLDEALANLAERLIVAPESGTVVSRLVEVGDVVGPGSPIFSVVDMNRLYVKVYVPESDVAKLRLGDAADVLVDAFPDRVFAARISRISDQAEFTPKNVETAEERLKLVFGVELSFANADGVLKPGMPADCRIRWTTSAEHASHAN